jgi:hypothetical protein
MLLIVAFLLCQGIPLFAKGWLHRCCGIFFNRFWIAHEQTIGVVPKIKRICLILIVLPMKNKN